MAEFLSPEWISDLSASAGGVPVSPDMHLVVEQTVSDAGPSEVSYVIEIADGAIRVRPGRVEGADITFTQDRATAVAIARGELSAQAAFMAGRLRVGGDLRAVLDRARELAAMVDVFAGARATTTW